MGSFDLQMQLLGWWIAFPVCFLVVVTVSIWKFGAIKVLTVLSAACAVFVVVLLFASRRTHYDVLAFWLTREPNGGGINRNFYVESQRGGVRSAANIRQIPFLPPEKHGLAEFHIRRSRFGEGISYPIVADRFSITRWDFLQKTLGFQVCWATFPKVPGQRAALGVYSVTVPHWFLLLLCSIFPSFALRRFFRRRYRLRHNLCLTCGFDRRAQQPNDRCPECGTIPETPKEAAKLPETLASSG